MKCRGASTCVPVCVPRVRRDTLAGSPFAMLERGVSTGSGSSGQTGMPGASGSVTSMRGTMGGFPCTTVTRAELVTPKKSKPAHLGDAPKPKPQEKDCLVRVLEVGIDGTDRHRPG